MSVLSKPYFHDEAKAFEYLESILWAHGIVCPHCGVIGGKVYEIKGKSARVGLKTCGECRKQFTVKVGTVFEHGRIPLHKFLQAVYLMTSSKKGISAHQLHRVLEVTYKTAWFLAHRIREAMRSGDLAPFGGEGGVVEVDETNIGRKQGEQKRRGYMHKFAVLCLVHRESGEARSFVIDKADRDTIIPIVAKNVDRETYIMTDDAGLYTRQFMNVYLGHGVVRHSSGQYGRGRIQTNTIEGVFSIFKRGMKGVYQHCGEKHLHRYLAEFDFRYSNREANGFNDGERSQQVRHKLEGLAKYLGALGFEYNAVGGTTSARNKLPSVKLVRHVNAVIAPKLLAKGFHFLKSVKPPISSSDQGSIGVELTRIVGFIDIGEPHADQIN